MKETIIEENRIRQKGKRIKRGIREWRNYE